MKRDAAILGVLIILCAINPVAQAAPQSIVRIPKTEEVAGEPAAGVHMLGGAPYVWFQPDGTNNYTWGSCFIQMGTNESGSAYGPYFVLSLSDPEGSPEKKFLFNRSILVTQNLSYRDAVFQLRAGNGTSSSKSAYTQYSTNETTPISWSAGMLGGNGEYRIRDTAGVDRMKITPATSDPNGATIAFIGTVSGSAIYANYQDVAEWVPASQKIEPGTVVVLNLDHPNEVAPSTTPYDPTVAGVVSVQPGVLLGKAGANKVAVATTGRVLVKVDATHAPIHIGDLLVTGDDIGTAKRSEPIDVGGMKIHRTGTVIGKALQPLASGTGEILVLLTLQ